MIQSKWINKLVFLCVGLAFCLCTTSFTRAADSDEAYLQADPEDVQAWREMRFGLFIHWGPVSLKGTEIGWSRGGERRGTGGTGTIPVEVYDNLYTQFNPVKFNADEWVQIAKAAGMKYLVFTSKHHDGFSMFDSQVTDYKITNSPFKRDVVKELADACHKAGLKLGYYYSPVDWYHPDYRTENHARYIKFMHDQLREICSNYGKIDIIWFDGLGGTADDWDSHNLFKMIRRLQPHVIINNRAGLPADHDTPEQRIGKFQTDRPWETCMTICRQWAWKPDDTMKSLKQCIETLVRVAGGDGNFLFNVGPMPDGRIEPRQVERLKEMGDWLDKYGKTIYGTRGGPFRPGAWGASTYKGNTIYIHALNRSHEQLKLPAIPNKIIASNLLTGGKATVKQTNEAILITIPKAYRHELDTIIELKLDGPAGEIDPVSLPSKSLAFQKKVRASNIYQNLSLHGPDKAVDDDPTTRWATDYGVKQAWLEVDLGKPETFDQVDMSEEYGRIRKFELQYKDGEEWKTFARDSRIRDSYSTQFEPVTARYVRLNILDAIEGPTIYEFHVLASK
ncbi:MAG: alpha-L-fucosidase [Sedimentisphaerales bacterium]|nr:alpha-L-fucosidase [Sedimentisphaerales bacterium]